MNDKERLKQIFAENLKRELLEHNKNQNDLCTHLKLTSSTVSDWATGKKYPRMDKVQKIADYLGIMKSDLTEERSLESRFTPNIKTMTHTVPIYGRVPAGVPFEAIQEILGDVAVPDKIAKKKDLFALKIVGDSMDKVLPNGCIAVFQKVVEVNQGEIAAVMVNGDDATVKHFTKSFTGCILEPDSHNSKHQMRFISKEDGIDVRVIGKLLWYCMDINGID